MKVLLLGTTAFLGFFLIVASLYVAWRYVNTKLTTATMDTQVIDIQGKKFVVVNTSNGVAVTAYGQ